MEANFILEEKSNLEQKFEELISTYVDTKVGVSEYFLPEDLANRLRQKIFSLHETQSMHAAGIGNDVVVVTDVKVRGDEIYWLDRSHNDPLENEFLDLIDAYVQYLNSSCYTGITGYEFHYTLYKEGSFYKRHLDQFQTDQSRQFSMITYLNEDWKSSDGGELLIQLEGAEQSVSPTHRKAVFFKSNELEHEVLITHADRLSITGWLKRD